jgi:peptide/nickel transport system permease protein
MTETRADGSLVEDLIPLSDLEDLPPAAQNVNVGQAYWSLVWWKFKKNRMAVVGGIIVVLFYVVSVGFAEFFAPYTLDQKTAYLEARPQQIVFKDKNGNFSLRPAVYGLEQKIDMATRKRTYEVTPDKIYPLRLFVRAAPYKLLGVIPM